MGLFRNLAGYAHVGVVVSFGVAIATGSAGCGPPRDPAYEFEEKICGTLAQPRNASPAPEAAAARIRGHATRIDDDTVAVTLAPLVSLEANALVEWTAAGVAVSGSATGSLACELELVSDVEVPQAVDIVFVLDTTGSMFWAIDGVKAGIEAFLDIVAGFNVDARVGGIEFGDEIRTNVPLGTLDEFEVWLDNMTAIGGGDAPENPLDSIQVVNGWSYRPHALRYMIVITDTGMHESTDDTECSDTTLRATQELLDPSTFLTVVHPNVGAPDGVHPRELTRALGGLFVALGSSSLVEFNVSTDTPADDVLRGIAVLTCTGAGDSGAVDVQATVDDEPVTATFALE